MATRKAVLFTRAMNKRYGIFEADSFKTMNRIELESATVAINAKVVHAVLHFLSAETLYKNRCMPIKNNAITANVYQLDMMPSMAYYS